MTIQILLSSDKKRISVAPGATVELNVTVENLTTLLEQVTVRLEGIDSQWVQVIPQVLPVFAQSRATARVIVGPPQDPSRSTAGIWPLRICATAHEHPGQEGTAEAELEIQLVGSYRLQVAKASGNENQAIYPIQVSNEANAPLTLGFSSADAAGAVWCKFDPFRLSVPAGGEATGSATVKPKRAGSETPVVDIEITAQGEYAIRGAAPIAAPALCAGARFPPVGMPARSLMLSLKTLEAVAGEARFQVQVKNPASEPLAVRLSAAGQENDLDFRLQPAELSLAGRGEASATLGIRPRVQAPQGQTLSRHFTVTAQPIKGGQSPVSAEGICDLAGQQAARPLPWPLIGCAVLLVLLILAGCLLALVRILHSGSM